MSILFSRNVYFKKNIVKKNRDKNIIIRNLQFDNA